MKKTINEDYSIIGDENTIGRLFKFYKNKKLIKTGYIDLENKKITLK